MQAQVDKWSAYRDLICIHMNAPVLLEGTPGLFLFLGTLLST